MQLCLMLRGEGFKGNENQIGRVSGQVGLPKFTNTYHLNRKQNGNIVWQLLARPLPVLRTLGKLHYSMRYFASDSRSGKS